jgi:hypothetical protein
MSTTTFRTPPTGHYEGRAMPWFDAIAVAVAFIAMAALVVVLMRGER